MDSNEKFHTVHSKAHCVQIMQTKKSPYEKASNELRANRQQVDVIRENAGQVARFKKKFGNIKV